MREWSPTTTHLTSTIGQILVHGVTVHISCLSRNITGLLTDEYMHAAQVFLKQMEERRLSIHEKVARS